MARMNAQDPQLIQEHFERFMKVREQYGIGEADCWNFNETGFRCGIMANDWVISTDPHRRIYSAEPENREPLTDIKCINGVGGEILPFLILTGVQLLVSFFTNNLHDNRVIMNINTVFNNDYISLQ